MKIIMISGWKKSGKDTSADYLIKHYGFEKISFAAPLKDLVSELYGIPRADCDNQDLKEKPLMHLPAISSDKYTSEFIPINSDIKEVNGQKFWSIRSLCIMVGSTNRAVSPDFWVKKAVAQMDRNSDKTYVISDVRFKNEIRELEAFAGKENLTTIRINRLDVNPSTDASEIDLDDWNKFDYIIDNRSTLQFLYSNLDKTVF